MGGAQAPQYRIGTLDEPWGDAERAAWLAQTTAKRSYADEVVSKLDGLKDRFEVLSDNESQGPVRCTV